MNTSFYPSLRKNRFGNTLGCALNRSKCLSLFFILAMLTQGRSQVDIGLQNFEASGSTMTYSASGGTTQTGSSTSSDLPASSPFFVSSNTGYRITNGTATITTANVSGLNAYYSKTATVRLAAFSIASSGNGMDGNDLVTMAISLDGGTTYSNEVSVEGNSNAYWGYSTGTGIASATYDGNNSATNFQTGGGGNRTTDGYSTVTVNLPESATQVRIRITMVNNSNNEAWLIDDIRVTGFAVTNFYSKSTGNLNLTSTWGVNTDGTGAAPANFTANGQVFNIRNNATPTIAANWTVSGTGSKVIVGDGANACNFSVPSGFAFNGPVDVSANGTLTLQNATIPTIGTCAATSTVDYASSGNQNITATTYGHLKTSTGGTKTLQNDLTIVAGNLTIGSGSTLSASGSGTRDIELAGDWTNNGTFTASNDMVTLNGSGAQSIGGANSTTFEDLLVNKSAGTVTLTNNQIVVGTLTLTSGLVALGNNNLTISARSGGSSTSYVSTSGTGKLIIVQTTDSGSGELFPVGNGSYTPITIDPSNNNSNFGVRVVDGFSAESSGCSGFVTDDAVKKMWIVSRESGTDNINSVITQWNATDEGSSFTRTSCGVVQYLSGNWENPTNAAASGSNPYTRTRSSLSVSGGTFGVLDNNASVNLSAPTGTSNSPICAGLTLNLNLSGGPVSGATYQWSKSGGGFTPPAGASASIPNAQTTDSGNYLLTMTKYGCNYTSSAVPVTVNPAPSCSIMGPDPVCASSTGHVYTGSGGGTYVWSIAGNGTISGSTTNPTVTVNAGATGTYTVTVVVTNAGCTSSCSKTVTIGDNVPPNALCKNATVQLDANGNASITTGQIDNGSNDACGAVGLSLSQSSFNCSDRTPGPGILGNALNFDGANDYTERSPLSALGSGDFTFEFWYKANSHSSFPVLFAQDQSGVGTPAFRVEINSSNNSMSFFFSSTGASVSNLTPTNSLTVGAWTHYAIVRSGNTFLSYVNGVLQATTSASGTPTLVGNTFNFRIGARRNSVNAATNPFNGTIDEFRVWNVARSQTQIQNNRYSELAPQSGLYIYYKFNQGVASGNNTGLTTLNDGSGNSLNSTLNNFALNGSTSNWIAGAPYPAGSGVTVVLTVTDGSSNTSTCTANVIVQDLTAPTLVCPSNQSLNANAAGCTAAYTIADPVSDNCAGATWGATFSGNPNGNPSNLSGIADGSGSGPVNFNLGTTTVVLSASDVAANPATTCSFTVTVNNPVTCSITGSDPVCSGSTGNVYSGPGGMSSYSWGISGNGTIIGSSTGSAVTVTAGAAGTYTVSVTVTNANGCTSSCSKTVTVNANPTCSISGPATVCANSSSNAYSAPGGMSNYAWSLSGNGTIDGATNTQNLSVDAGAAGTYTVSLTLTDANGCTSSCTQMVTVSAAPTAIAGGPYYTTDCTGSTPVSISATASGPGTWSGGAGSFASPTSTSTTYTPTAGEAGTSVMLVWTTTGTGGCGNLGDMATVHVGKQEISLEGNGMNIANGDAIPTSADNTDFGWALVAGGTVSRNFTVMNNGLSALTLPGGTPVTIGGANAGDFTVTLQPASPVAAGNLSLFSIEFDPSGPGLRTATVSIANNDCNESPFTFDIQGTGRVPQQITVLGLGTPIVNRASTASVSDDTDFGSVMVGNMVTHTFTVENIANGAPLGLSGAPRVAIADLNATDFSVTAQPASPVNGGGSTTFTVKFQPTATGLRTAIVIIACDDLPENAFVFTVNGVGN